MSRDLQADDRAEWQRLYQGYQAFYGFHDRPAEFYDKAFARLLSGQAGDFRGLVHADGDRLRTVTVPPAMAFAAAAAAPRVETEAARVACP